jgi:hypothetical protein
MKHLLSGVAIAAVLAIAAPVWAQTAPTNQYGQPMQTQGMPGAAQSSPSSHPAMPAATAPAAPSASSAAAPTKRMATKRRAKRATRQMAARHGKSRRAVASSGDNMTNQLNREELNRIQSGGSSPPGATNQYGQPMQTQGMPGASQSSPSSHPAMPAR